jgi:hypothetical protein
MAWLTEAFARMKTGPGAQSVQLRLPDEHVIDGGSGRPLEAEKDYFTVQVHTLRLGYGRKLWQHYTPTLWARVDLNYAAESVSMPYLVGPSRLDNSGEPVPDGMVYKGIRVAGPIPYRGGTIGIAMVLSRLATENSMTTVLGFVDSIAGAFGAAAALAPYVKIGGMVEGALSTLLGLGAEPIAGMRDTLTPDAPDAGEFRTGWYLIADRPPPGPLWVVDRDVRCGPTAETAKPLADTTYVLYSVSTLPRDQGRNDARQLPDLAADKKLIERLAGRPDADSMRAAEILFADLGVRMVSHPALVRDHAEALINEWRAEMYQVHENASAYTPRGATERRPEDADLDAITGLVLQIAPRP